LHLKVRSHLHHQEKPAGASKPAEVWPPKWPNCSDSSHHQEGFLGML